MSDFDERCSKLARENDQLVREFSERHPTFERCGFANIPRHRESSGDDDACSAAGDMESALDRLLLASKRGLEAQAARRLRDRLEARSRLRAKLEHRAAARRDELAEDRGLERVDFLDAVLRVQASHDAALVQTDAEARIDDAAPVSPEDLSALAAELVDRDDEAARRAADARAARRQRQRAELLRRLDARRRRGDGDERDEFRDWAELCRAGDAEELDAMKANQARLYGDVLGRCAARGAAPDVGDVARLVLEHDAARRMLSDKLARDHAERRAALIARVRRRTSSEREDVMIEPSGQLVSVKRTIVSPPAKTTP